MGCFQLNTVVDIGFLMVCFPLLSDQPEVFDFSSWSWATLGPGSFSEYLF